MSIFSRYNERLRDQIVQRLGWRNLRPVQELASEAILNGQNVIVLAPTAGGKTEAAVFPVLSLLLDNEPKGVGALYVCPLRALLNNLEDRLGVYTEMVGLSRFKWHGDRSQGDRAEFIRNPASVLMTTPESLEVMMISPRVPLSALFSDLRFVIIDEIHSFAQSDRGAHLLCLLERLRKVASPDFQRIGLSATVGNPELLLEWLRGSSQRSGSVINPPHERGKRLIKIERQDELPELAERISQVARGKKSLLFCSSRRLTETVAEKMKHYGINVFVHHSSVSKEERERAEQQFADATNTCIICTSTLELGIDIGDLDKVFQLDSAGTVSSFLQRMGRTGRRPGVIANTTFFCTSEESGLFSIAIVELAKAGWVEPLRPGNRCWHILVHQLMAMCLQHGSVTRSYAWEILSLSYSCAGISLHEYQRFVDYLIKEDILFEESGRLSMGKTAESVFGRRNFMELYSVFSSNVEYTVLTQTEYELGTLEEDFVLRIVEENMSFILAGQAWLVAHIDHIKKRIYVIPAPAGEIPSWQSFALRLMGFELCQQVKALICSETMPVYIDQVLQKELSEKRALLQQLLITHQPYQIFDRELIWYTYAGGKINYTLKYALQRETGYKITISNDRLKISGDSAVLKTFLAAVEQISQRSYWEHPEVERDLRKKLPRYRFSKFQFCLPDKLQNELIADCILDIPATIEFLDMFGIRSD